MTDIVEQKNPAIRNVPVTESPTTGASPRRLEVDVRSRDAFELLKLGEAIVDLQADLRNLRLEKEDLRFERERYKASAADYQGKLISALEELDAARSFREEAEQLRREVVAIAKEFRGKLADQLQWAAEQQLELQRNHDDLLVAQNKAHEGRLREVVTTLKSDYESLLRDETARAHELQSAAEKQRELQRGQHDLLVNQNKAHEGRLREVVGTLKSDYESLLRDEVVALAHEFQNKLPLEEPTHKKGRWWRT